MSTTSSPSSSAAAALVGNSKDLVGEILSRLPLKSVMQCRLVCKEWCSLTSTQSFIEMHENNQFSSDNNNRCFVVQYYDQSTSASDHFNTLFVNLDDDYYDFEDNNTNITMIREYMHLSNIFSQVGEDGNGNKMYTIVISNSFFHKIKTYYHINLISSCRGFLLFTAKPAAKKPAVSCMARMFGCWQPMEEEYPALILYNPVTKEQFTVITPPSKYVYCGFYYHLPTKEHRILYRVIDEAAAAGGGGIVTFLVIELENNYFMRFLNLDVPNTSSTYYYLPDPSTPPVISNGSLHWIVSEDDLHGQYHHPIIPDCSCTILSFGMESEEFRLMPHPTLSHSCSRIGSNAHRHQMNLLEMEGGVLCLCDDHGTYDPYSNFILEIYVMEDYEKWTWVRRYRINLDGCINKFYWQNRFHCKAFQILQGDQLLLQVDPPDGNLDVEFVLYSLNDHKRLKRSMPDKKKKKKKKKKKRQTSTFNVVVFTPSLASIYQRNRSSATDIKFLLVENGSVF